jgi:GST-like protein
MIKLFFWPTPNGHKITLALEETGLPYRLQPIHIGKGEQFAPEFLAFSPNNRIPAITDYAPDGAAAPVSLFESGAILLYLAEKTGQLLAPDPAGRREALQWLFWQIGGLGPMAGQANHFCRYAPEPVPYAIDRYTREAKRLYGVLDRRLSDRPFVAGDDYSIADIAIYPWIVQHELHRQCLDEHPNVHRWWKSVAARPATVRAYDRAATIKASPPGEANEAEQRILFGQRHEL